MSAPAIEIERVGKRFGDVVALDDVGFAVMPGEIFTLVGPSGCGKTTLLRLIGGFEEPTSGTVRLAGRDMRGVPPNRRDVHTVFQSYALFPHLDVRSNVGFALDLRGLPRREVDARVAEILAVVRLDGLEARRPRELSGGQQQRVALARALLDRPAAVLLDEPLAALDPELRRGMQGEIVRIQRSSGVAFLLVTHDRDEALALSDRIAVMRAGRIEQLGTPESVYDEPESGFVASFLGAANLLDATVERSSRDLALLRLANGALIPTPGSGAETGLVHGGRVSLLVRPEHVRLGAAPSAAESTGFPAVLRKATFHGARIRYVAVDDAGREIEADVVAESGARDTATSGMPRVESRLRPGERVWASWAKGAARVLPGPSCDGPELPQPAGSGVGSRT